MGTDPNSTQQVFAQNNGLEEIVIDSWIPSEDDVTVISYDDGYDIQTSTVTWTNPNDPSDSYNYESVSLLNAPEPTYTEPVYDGDAWFGSNFIGPGPDEDPFTLGYLPVDAMDQATMFHDKSYYDSHASGFQGALFDMDVRHADLELWLASKDVIDGFLNGDTDPVTGLPFALSTFFAAVLVETAFKLIVESKYGVNL